VASWRRTFSRLNVLFIVMFTLVILMIQSWNNGVCWIGLVFVTELSVVIGFVHTAVLSIKTAFNMIKIHLLIRIMLLFQWSVVISNSVGHVVNVFGKLKYEPRLFPNICWHSPLKTQCKFVQQTKSLSRGASYNNNGLGYRFSKLVELLKYITMGTFLWPIHSGI
jgi:hypothetical protein